MARALRNTLCAGLLLAIAGCYYDRESDLYPQPYCNLDTVKWSTTIRPVVMLNCAYVGCHAALNPQAGVDLSTYHGVDSIVKNGALLGCITHNGNYVPMPYQQPALSDCKINQIRLWINTGSKED